MLKMAYCQDELQPLVTKRRIHEEMLKIFCTEHCILLTSSMKSVQETTGEIFSLNLALLTSSDSKH